MPRPKRCPHADKALKLFFLKDGSAVCPECYDGSGDVPVRTNKKIWAGSAVDGPQKNREIIQKFGQRITERAAKHRQRFSEPQHPVLRERMGLSVGGS